jgi:hypothetical protein
MVRMTGAKRYTHEWVDEHAQRFSDFHLRIWNYAEPAWELSSPTAGSGPDRGSFDFATLKRRCRRILLLARVGTEHPAVGFSQPRGQADRGPGEGVTSEPGNDAIATLPDRCSGGGYRLSRGRETSCHRRPPLGRALIRSRVGTVPATSKTAIVASTRRPESPAHHTGDR